MIPAQNARVGLNSSHSSLSWLLRNGIARGGDSFLVLLRSSRSEDKYPASPLLSKSKSATPEPGASMMVVFSAGPER
jgi:hypothetical protein